MGDFKLARKYYSESLNLKEENNIRSLFGIFLCCNAMKDKKSKISKIAETELIKNYAKDSKSILPFVKELME
jgi:hypothetical protein